MTVKELSQLYWLRREIEEDSRKLRELEERLSAPKPSNYDGMPHTTRKGDALENAVAQIVDLQSLIAAKQQRCLAERLRLEQYISAIDDSVTRQIFHARFVDGLSWNDTAQALGGYNTPEGVRQRVYRQLKE